MVEDSKIVLLLYELATTPNLMIFFSKDLGLGEQVVGVELKR